MHSRCCALFGAWVSIFAVGESFAETSSTENLMAAHQGWHGRVSQSVTRDGSILSEYTAQTPSLNMKGATLSISMIPRFSCLPVISFVVTDPAITYRAAQVESTLKVDYASLDFPAILDRDGPEAWFTLSSVGADQKKLRVLFDRGTEATFTWSVDSNLPQLSNTNSASDTSGTSGNIEFSLLGSQKTLEIMEEMCWAHVPIPLAK